MPSKVQAHPALAEFRMETWPFYWIARVSRQYAQEMDRLLKREGLDISRWRVLMVLSEIHPASISQLAEHAIVKLPTMTKLVARMAHEGLITTGDRPGDRRVTQAFLTELGRAAVTTICGLADQIFERAFADISEGDMVKLNSTLQSIYMNLAAVKVDVIGAPN